MRWLSALGKVLRVSEVKKSIIHPFGVRDFTPFALFPASYAAMRGFYFRKD